MYSVIAILCVIKALTIGISFTQVFVHRHEAANGRTSCISQHIMGFNEKKEVVHQLVPASASSAQKTKSWRDVVNKSRSLLTLIDLAGHEKYLKTTIAGLTGCYPDFALVVVGANMGVTKMTKEHLGCVIALDLPLICVITKTDIAPDNVLQQTKKTLVRILESKGARRKAIEVRSEKDVDTCVANLSSKICPMFLVSSVNGTGLEFLYSYLSRLRPLNEMLREQSLTSPVEFSIDETFVVTGVGLILSGTVLQGTLDTSAELVMGPFGTGEFKKVQVKSIHCKRTPVEVCTAGNSCAISVRLVNRREQLRRIDVRRGMVIVDPAINPRSVRRFLAEVLVLHHPTTIKLGYQAVIHCGIIRQTATMTRILRDEFLRTGDRAQVEFKFIMRPEYIKPGQVLIFREGNTKGVGRVVKILEDDEDSAEALAAVSAAAAAAAAAGALPAVGGVAVDLAIPAPSAAVDAGVEANPNDTK